MKWRTVTQEVLTTDDGGSTQDFTISGFGTPQAWFATVTWAQTNQVIRAGAAFGVGMAYEIGVDEDHRHHETAAIDSSSASNYASRAQGSGSELQVINATDNTSALEAEGAVTTDGVTFTYGVKAPSGTGMLAHVTLISGLDDVVVGVTTTTQTAVTSLGFQPNAVVALSTITSGLARLGFCTGWAVDTGSGTEACATGLRSISAAPNTFDQQILTGSFLTFGTFAGTLNAYDIDSWDSGGFSYSASQNGSTGFTFNYMALRFPSDVQLGAGLFASPTSVGTLPISLGFRPQAGLLASTWLSATNSLISATNTIISNGFHVFSSNEEVSASFSVNETSGTSETFSRVSDQAYDVLDHVGALGLEATRTIQSSGLDLVFTTVDSVARYGMYLAFGGEAEVVSGAGDIIQLGEAVWVARFLAIEEGLEIAEAGFGLGTNALFTTPQGEVQGAGPVAGLIQGPGAIA